MSNGTLVEAHGAALSHDCGCSLGYPRRGSTRRARATPSPYSTMIGPATNDWVTGSMLGVTMAATATPTLTPTATPTLTPTATPALTPPAVPTPVVFEKGDEDLAFYLYTASFELEWMVMGAGWIELTVFHQEDGSETIVCTTEKLWAPTSGSKVCDGGPGDFRLGVVVENDCVACTDWFVSITPQ